MERAKINDITFDEEDAKLFSLQSDLLLKAKSIQYSILPKLNVVLEEALSRVRKIYGVEVFNEDSHVHFSPNFREKRENDLKINYDYAVVGITGRRVPIWKGLARTDGKAVKIQSAFFSLVFYKRGLFLSFRQVKNLKLTDSSRKKYLDFFRQNSQFVQRILQLSGITYLPSLKENSKVIISFDDFLEELINDKYYYLTFEKHISLPTNLVQLNDLLNAFVLFYPIYDSIIRIAKGEKIIFDELISMLKVEDIVVEKNNIENEKIKLSDEEEIKTLSKNVDKKNIVKTGVRWQVFERDDFKCVACGISAKEGAILHIDHIVPRSKGGKNEMNNYQTLCHKCNVGKSNKSQKNLRKSKN